MIDTHSPEIRFTLHAVQVAAQLIRQVQAEMVSATLTKEDRSPVTVADYASQAVVARRLEDAFPNDPLVAEEDAAMLRSPEAGETLSRVSAYVARLMPDANPEAVCRWIDRGKAAPARRFWTLDPIDGTKGFLRGDQYAVALALLVDGQVQVGALGCPQLEASGDSASAGKGALVIAARGQGAWVTSLDQPDRFMPLRVSSCDDPRQARLLRSFESGHTNVSQIDEFAALLGVGAEPVRMDSQAKYAVLAAGAGELILRLLSPAKPDYREKIWDQAAGSLVVEEAGGLVSDLHGKPLDFTAGRTLANNRGILASNRRLHPAALRALRELGA